MDHAAYDMGKWKDASRAAQYFHVGSAAFADAS